jgi:hypothetical protein
MSYRLRRTISSGYVCTQFEKLNQLSPEIKSLFKVFSFLDLERIPVEMIAQGAKEWLDPQHRLKDLSSQPPKRFTYIPRVLLIGYPDSLADTVPDGYTETTDVVSNRISIWCPELFVMDARFNVICDAGGCEERRKISRMAPVIDLTYLCRVPTHRRPRIAAAMARMRRVHAISAIAESTVEE